MIILLYISVILSAIVAYISIRSTFLEVKKVKFSNPTKNLPKENELSNYREFSESLIKNTMQELSDKISTLKDIVHQYENLNVNAQHEAFSSIYYKKKFTRLANEIKMYADLCRSAAYNLDYVSENFVEISVETVIQYNRIFEELENTIHLYQLFCNSFDKDLPDEDHIKINVVYDETKSLTNKMKNYQAVLTAITNKFDRISHTPLNQLPGNTKDEDEQK